MRKFIMTLIAAVLAVVMSPVLAAAEADGPDIAGDWLRNDGSARIHVASCGPQMCATNTWIKDETSGEFVGDRLVMTLRPQGTSRLVGAAFDVRRNMIYSVQISINNGDSMRTHGCLVEGIVCKTMSWTRTQ
jgi:uncharacterized protein (DUF2147 family)